MRKKVLYAVQATGNGHLSRCMEFYPALSKYADVDVLLSGIQGDLKLPFEVKYHKHGMGFIFGKKGGIDYLKTLISLRPFRFIWDIFTIDLKDYDMVINDFEPITAWACRMRRKPCIGLSHQAAFLSKRTPRPKHRNWLAEFIFKHFAPVNRKVGLHFQRYDSYIFTPVVRSEIRQLSVDYKENQCLVYLPAYSHEVLIPHFKLLPAIEFVIFSKHSDRYIANDNIKVFPVGQNQWQEYMRSSDMAIVGAGFEGTSEMLFLHKKLMVVPMTDQYEQHCNAEALKRMGVSICYLIDDNFVEALNSWKEDAKVVEVEFPEVSDDIARLALGL